MSQQFEFSLRAYVCARKKCFFFLKKKMLRIDLLILKIHVTKLRMEYEYPYLCSCIPYMPLITDDETPI